MGMRVWRRRRAVEAGHIDVSILVACAADEVIREQPSLLRLLFAGRRIRRKCKFRPSIADIVEASWP